MNSQTIVTLNADFKDFVGGFYHQVPVRLLPALDAPIEDIAALAQLDDITDRTSYLAWVARYKTLIHRAEDEIRMLKGLRKDPALGVRAPAQMYHATLASYVTTAIHLRRLAKRWSVHQRKILQAAA